MKINRIKFYNYKPFFGEQTVDIPPNGKIVIIRGENGAGKTTIINALTLCLYNDSLNWEEAVNAKAIYNAQVGEEVKTQIEINFHHEGKNHIIKRGCTTTKSEEGIANIKEFYILNVFENDATFEEITKPPLIENRINAILNKAVKNYFFFDGAQIEKFTNPDHSSHVQAAIRGLLKIEAITRARASIKKVLNEIRLSIKGESPDDRINSQKEEIQYLETQRNNLEEDLRNLNKEIAAASKSIAKTQDEIDTIKMNSQHEKQLSSTSDEINEYNDELKKCKEDLIKALSLSYISFADRLMIEALKAVKSSGKKLISPAILKGIIKLTLDEKKCHICETRVTREMEEALWTKLPKIIDDKVGAEDSLNLVLRLNDRKNDGKIIYRDICQLQSRKISLEQKLSGLIETYKSLEDKINKSLPDYDKHKAMLETLQDSKQQKEQERFDVSKELEIVNKSLSTAYVKLKAYTAKNEKYKKQNAKLSVSMEITDEIEQIYNKYEQVEIEKINIALKKNYDTLIRKNGVYTNVFIDDNYSLYVERIFTDYNALKQISYGERQMLSLSLILSLATVSGDQAPFVMDTPMGNLDSVHRQHFFENIPNIIDQLILLVTSLEFTNDLYEISKKHITVEYRLNYSDGGTTRIEKVV